MYISDSVERCADDIQSASSQSNISTNNFLLLISQSAVCHASVTVLWSKSPQIKLSGWFDYSESSLLFIECFHKRTARFTMLGSHETLSLPPALGTHLAFNEKNDFSLNTGRQTAKCPLDWIPCHRYDGHASAYRLGATLCYVLNLSVNHRVRWR